MILPETLYFAPAGAMLKEVFSAAGIITPFFTFCSGIAALPLPNEVISSSSSFSTKIDFNPAAFALDPLKRSFFSIDSSILLIFSSRCFNSVSLLKRSCASAFFCSSALRLSAIF